MRIGDYLTLQIFGLSEISGHMSWAMGCYAELHLNGSSICVLEGLLFCFVFICVHGLLNLIPY